MCFFYFQVYCKNLTGFISFLKMSINLCAQNHFYLSFLFILKFTFHKACLYYSCSLFLCLWIRTSFGVFSSVLKVSSRHFPFADSKAEMLFPFFLIKVFDLLCRPFTFRGKYFFLFVQPTLLLCRKAYFTLLWVVLLLMFLFCK